MRLHRVQQRLLSGDQMLNCKEVPTMKGAIGRHAIGWMKIYFQLNCEVMPTIGRMHLSNNYTRGELYDVYRSEMVDSSNKYVTYNQFKDCGEHGLGMLLFRVKYAWGIARFVHILKVWLKVQRHQWKRI